MKKKKIKLCLTKQLLNMFKLWCEWGISLKSCGRSTQNGKVCSVYIKRQSVLSLHKRQSMLSLHKRQSVLGLHKRLSVLSLHKRQSLLSLHKRQRACENNNLISLSFLVLLFRLMSTVSVFSSVKCAFRHSRIMKTVNVKSLR